MQDSDINEMIAQREYHVSKVLSSQALKERWALIGYEPKPIQLKLF